VALLRCRIVVCGVVAVSLYVPYFVGHSRTLLLGPTEGTQQKYNNGYKYLYLLYSYHIVTLESMVAKYVINRFMLAISREYHKEPTAKMELTSRAF